MNKNTTTSSAATSIKDDKPMRVPVKTNITVDTLELYKQVTGVYRISLSSVLEVALKAFITNKDLVHHYYPAMAGPLSPSPASKQVSNDLSKTLSKPKPQYDLIKPKPASAPGTTILDPTDDLVYGEQLPGESHIVHHHPTPANPDGYYVVTFPGWPAIIISDQETLKEQVEAWLESDAQ
jgi:hypothetical protein